MISFGLDLAGYSSGTTTLARCEMAPDGTIHATVFAVDHLSKKYKGSDGLQRVVEQERAMIRHCIELGPLAVDVPLDLQGLPAPGDAQWVWQLTLRGVDLAFGGLPPLASLIGAPVARFQHVMDGFGGAVSPLLGARIFETYPAACLERLGIGRDGYKRAAARFDGARWEGRLRKGGAEGHSTIDDVAQKLGLQGPEGLELCDDDIDAIICALAVLDVTRHSLTGDRLEQVIRANLTRLLGADQRELRVAPPRGYVLLAARPAHPIKVRKRRLESVSALASVIENASSDTVSHRGPGEKTSFRSDAMRR